jgi:methylenetetrahydrofolate dehydrogenase (NADP+)/methenyltetrahydrofolate cyclohydrolase
MAQISGGAIYTQVQQLYEELLPDLRAKVRDTYGFPKRVAILRFTAPGGSPSDHQKAWAAEISANQKMKTFRHLGFAVTLEEKPATWHGFENWINSHNADLSVAAIIVQSPQPSHVRDYLHLIAPEKDIDGLRALPTSEGCATADGACRIITPFLIRYGYARGVAVVGSLGFVGTNLVSLLGQQAITAAIDSKTGLRPEHVAPVRASAIVATAADQCEMLDSNHLHSEQLLVVDCGFFPRTKNVRVGNVCPSARNIPQWITPVPGGMGPVEMAVLMERGARLICRQAPGWKLDPSCISPGISPIVVRA